MDNPKYLVNIVYVPSHVSGQSLVNISGVTQSMITYNSDYFQATMPELRISATGTSYNDALNNLLTVASSTTDNGQGPLSNTRTY
jgi:hypothetical protein